MELKRKIWLTIILLGLSFLLVWAVFYYYTAQNLSKTAEQNMHHDAEQILDRLEVDFLKLEGIVFSLVGKQTTLDFITEQDAAEYLIKSDGVDKLARDTIGPTDTVGHLLTYTTDGVYARFIGTMGNTAATRLYHTLSGSALPGYFGVTLEGVHYLCYASEIRGENGAVGIMTLLVSAGDLLDVSSDTGDYQVSLSFEGKIIASSGADSIGLDTSELIMQSELYQRRSVGFAPFEILVTAGQGYLSAAYTEFVVVEVIIAAVFIAILASFLRISNRHLFRPILQVIQGVEELGKPDTSDRLNKTGEDTFDALVEQVNNMLDRLDDLKEIELDRQKSLVTSLKKQINAHFTVNILNVINQLGRQGELEKAQTMTAGLSSLLQYVNAGDEFIDAVEELQVLRKYVAMMQIRYQSVFSVNFDWDDRLMGIDIPRMLVQPLIENAIEHGLDFIEAAGEINVSGKLDGDVVIFIVTDNGGGMEEEPLELLRHQLHTADLDSWAAAGTQGVALVNIQRRVRSYYGTEYGLKISSKIGKGTAVTLKLPKSGKEAGPRV